MDDVEEVWAKILYYEIELKYEESLQEKSGTLVSISNEADKAVMMSQRDGNRNNRNKRYLKSMNHSTHFNKDGNRKFNNSDRIRDLRCRNCNMKGHFAVSYRKPKNLNRSITCEFCECFGHKKIDCKSRTANLLRNEKG